MSRRWHLAHADGREWTKGELDDLAVRLKEETRIAPYDTACHAVCIDGDGAPVMLNEYGEWAYIWPGSHDAVVVWDE